MEPNRTPSANDLTTTEDNRSQNTKIAQDLERDIEEARTEDTDEAQEHFYVERHLEEDGELNIVDAVTTDLREEGMPKEPQGKVAKVEDFLTYHIGYDPDLEDYATFGEVKVLYDNGFIDIFYEVGDNLSSPDGLAAPIICEADPEVLEQAIAGEVPHASTESYERNGKNGVQFRYNEQDWLIATEEIGDAILRFEEELDLDSYSGR